MKKRILAIGLATMMVAGVVTGCTKNEPAPVPETAEETETDGEEPDAETEEPEAGGLAYETIIVGVDDTFAPMGFRDESNEIVGFDIELATAVGEVLGVEMVFQPIDWTMKEAELNAGNIDLIWNGYTITESRKEQVLFTNPYLNNRQVVLVLADSGIETLADLEGKVVATQEMSSGLEAIEAHPDVMDTFADLVTFGTYDECMRDMDAQRSDAVVGDEVLIRYYVSLHPDTKYVVLEEDLGDEEYGIGARKDDTALVDAVNAAINELKANGKGAEISEKWFEEDILQ